MESKIKYTYDALLALQAPASANVVATASSAYVDINKITKGRGDVQGRFGEGAFDVVVHITTLDHTTGDETYSAAFTSSDAAGANKIVHFTRAFVVGEVGKTFAYKFDAATIGLENANAAKFGIDWTLAGTTPILNYFAFVAPNKTHG